MNDADRKGRLSHRVIKGGFWLIFIRIASKILGFVRLVILARILSPNDFGLMGIALLTLMTMETFSRTGFYTALVQKKEEIEPYIDSAWTFTVIRGAILFGIVYFLAPYVAIFFNVPQAKLIIRIIGISMFIDGFTSVGIVYFRRDLEFNKMFKYRLAGSLADFIVAVSAAFLLRNVWALVFGKISGTLVMVLASYLLHPYKPRVRLDWEKARELFTFGKWVLGTSVVLFLLNQGGDILVGKLLGATMLGFYNMAYRLPSLTANEISQVIAGITFPAFSKLQHQISNLRDAYLKVLQVIAFFSFPIAGFTIILASDFTRIFLGEKWMPIVPAMQVLACWGLFHSIGSASGPMFKAIGRPDLETKLQAASLIFLGTIIYPLTVKWGMVGTSLAVFLNVFVFSPVAYIIIIRIIRCRVADFLKMLIMPLISAVIMMSVLVFVKIKIFLEINLISFPVLIILGAAVYLGIMQIIDIFTNYGIRATVYEQIISMRKRA